MFDEVFVHMAYAPSESSMLIRLYTNGDASAAAKVLDRIRLLLITELTMFSNLKGKILVPMIDKVTDCNLDDMAKQTDKHCILDLEYVTYPKIYAWVLKDVKKHAVPKPYKHPHGAITWVKLDKPMSAESVVDDLTEVEKVYLANHQSRIRREYAKLAGICKGEGCEEDCCKLRVFENRTLKSGIVIEDTALGEGREARQGSSVDVAYEAFVLRDDGLETDRWGEDRWGEAIDRATARDPFGFVVGSGEVIQGLSQGVIGMRSGGRRHIEVPQCYARRNSKRKR